MATCPNCYEFQGDAHVCKGQLGRRAVAFASAALVAGAGGAIGSIGLGLLGAAVSLDLHLVGFVSGLTAALVLLKSVR